MTQKLLDHLLEAGKQGVAPNSLKAHEQTTLEELQTRGEAVFSKGRWFALAATRFVAGRVTALRRERLEVTTWWRGSKRVWLTSNRSQIDAALGDFVLVQPARSAPSSRRSGGRRQPTGGRNSPERHATLHQVLSRAPAIFVARIAVFRGRSGWRSFSSRNVDLTRSLSVPRSLESREGEYFLLQLERGGDQPTVLEEFGDPDKTSGADIRIALAHHEIPEEFENKVLAQAKASSDDASKGRHSGRQDITDRLTMTIDGETAKDYDDAVSVFAQPNGGYRLDVHIADVAEFVEPGTALDDEAKRRGTSVYFPGRAVPMLPPALSEGACSLLPDVDRLAVTASIYFDAEGTVTKTSFHESRIRSRARLTYTEVAQRIGPKEERPKDAAPLAREVEEMLVVADRLLETLLDLRRKRGALELDLPTIGIQIGRGGQPKGVAQEPRNRAHLLVEEFMIAANSAVAEFLANEHVEGKGRSKSPQTLFRTHPGPSAERLEELEQALQGLYGEQDAAGSDGPGIDLGLEEPIEGPGDLQNLLDLARSSDERALLSMLILRSLGRAVYEPEPLGHFALSLEHYSHFTSPIRRYPDLVMHRLLKQTLRGEQPLLVGQAAQRQLGEDLSRLERRAEAAERDIRQWQKVRLLRSRIGESFEGRVTGIGPRGAFVSLVEFGADGMIRLEDPGLQPVEVNTGGQGVTTRQGSIQLGQTVYVRLTGVDDDRRSLNLELRADSAPRTADSVRGSKRESSGPARRNATPDGESDLGQPSDSTRRSRRSPKPDSLRGAKPKSTASKGPASKKGAPKSTASDSGSQRNSDSAGGNASQEHPKVESETSREKARRERRERPRRPQGERRSRSRKR